MKKCLELFVWLGLLLAPAAAVAQQAAPAPVPAEPVLSQTETIALQSLGEKLQENQKQAQAVQQTRADLVAAVRSVETEIAKAHPGYHLDEATGKLVKDTPAAPAERRPLPVPKPPVAAGK